MCVKLIVLMIICIFRERQTILFSATQTRKVEDLARLSIRPSAVYTGVHDDAATATVDGLQQGEPAKQYTKFSVRVHLYKDMGSDDNFFNCTTKLSFLGYVLCPAEQRFMLLYTFLKKNIGKKVMVRLSLLSGICGYNN